MTIAARMAFCAGLACVLLAFPVEAQDNFPAETLGFNQCGSEFVTFGGRRWLPGSNAATQGESYDELNIFTVPRDRITLVRAFHYGDDLRAFVSLDLGDHRLAYEGRNVIIVVVFETYRALIACIH